jgi:FHS family glucose/mannose:H+ symporter-like MFS transporter
MNDGAPADREAVASGGPPVPLATTFVVAATLAMGMYVGGAALPAIRSDLGLDLAAGGLVVGLPWGAFVVGALAAPVAVRLLGIARAIAFAMAAAAGALVAAIIRPSFALLLLGVTLFGACGAMGHVSGTAVAADAQRRGRPKALLLVALAFASGAFGAPLMASVLVGQGMSWRAPYLVVAIAAVAVAFRTWARRPPPAGTRRDARPAARGVLREPPVVRAAIGLMLYLGTEATITGWLVTLLRDRDLSQPASAAALSMFWVGVIAGRVLLVTSRRVVADERYIVWAGVSGTVGFLLLTQLPVGTAGSMALALVTGVAVAGLFPAIMASGTSRSRAVDGAAAVTVAAGGAGGIVVPWLVGVAAESIGLGLALAFAAVVPAALALAFALPLAASRG